MELALLPIDLARWDQAPGGDLFVVPAFSDVRPLRGAAGLLDWRLNGRLSECLREQRFAGARAERLLMPTRRIPWRAVLVLGLGSARDFDDEAFRDTLDNAFSVMRGMGIGSLAMSLPGREGERIAPERAVTLLREVSRDHEHVRALTLLDTAPALKTMGELLGLTIASRTVASKAAAVT
jgi:leucyl aminopeptidase